MAETTAIGEEREALELGLREWLDDDDATSAAQWVIEIGWRPPAEVTGLCARQVAEALGEAHAAIVARRQTGLPHPTGVDDTSLPMLRAGLALAEDIVTALAAEYRDGTR